jgi:hypothetical protein
MVALHTYFKRAFLYQNGSLGEVEPIKVNEIENLEDKPGRNTLAH